jgi:8-oxo-dGTP pyrophosphatase MutT (NUDIX family)
LTEKKLSDLVLNSTKFLKWKTGVEKSGSKITKLRLLAGVSRNDSDLFAAFIDCEMISPEGDKSPRCMVIRGNTAVVVPVIYCEDNQIYTLMIKQRRPIDGEYKIEFPGGLLDNGDENPIVVAQKEVEEELNLRVQKNEIMKLSEKPISICSGILDEKAHFFYFKKKMLKKELDAIHDQLSGHNHEGEFLKIQVVNFKDVKRFNNSSALIGLKLIEKALGHNF